MDLYAYAVMDRCEEVRDYVVKHYGEPPRWRGVRMMRDEERADGSTYQMELYNEFVGKDVIYIHTRCGGDNFDYYGMGDWEHRNDEYYLDAADDDFDRTYRDTYLKAVPGEDYDRALAALRELVGR